MSIEEQQIAVAKLRGWHTENCAHYYHRKHPEKYRADDPHYSRFTALISPEDIAVCSSEEIIDRHWLKNTPPINLDTMHAAEEGMPMSKSASYYIELSKITMRDNPEDGRIMWKRIHATAQQRAEAFIAVMGK